MEGKDTPVQGILSPEKATAVKATETRMWQGCVFWNLQEPKRFLGTALKRVKEKYRKNKRGEQREIPTFRKEVDVNIETQTQADTKSYKYPQG